jgi:hypothetical protein
MLQTTTDNKVSDVYDVYDVSPEEKKYKTELYKLFQSGIISSRQYMVYLDNYDKQESLKSSTTIEK